jgi:hypothetical protein
MVPVRIPSDCLDGCADYDRSTAKDENQSQERRRAERLSRSVAVVIISYLVLLVIDIRYPIYRYQQHSLKRRGKDNLVPLHHPQ